MATKNGLIAKYFGKKQGQTLQDLVEEVKQLSPKDIDELHDGIKNETYTY